MPKKLQKKKPYYDGKVSLGFQTYMNPIFIDNRIIQLLPNNIAYCFSQYDFPNSNVDK